MQNQENAKATFTAVAGKRRIFSKRKGNAKPLALLLEPVSQLAFNLIKCLSIYHIFGIEKELPHLPTIANPVFYPSLKVPALVS